MGRNKIDTHGNYKKYYGVTIICPLFTNINEYHSLLCNRINTGKGYSILPIDSMHMTIRNLFTQSHYNNVDEYKKDLELKLPLLRKAQQLLDGISSQHCGSSIEMKVTKNYIKGIKLDPSNSDEAELLAMNEMLIDKVLKQVGLGKFERNEKHMTLAYQYDTTIKNNINKNELNNVLPYKLIFGKPVICSFDSMLQYDQIT